MFLWAIALPVDQVLGAMPGLIHGIPVEPDIGQEESQLTDAKRELKLVSSSLRVSLIFHCRFRPFSYRGKILCSALSSHPASTAKVRNCMELSAP